MSPRKENKVNRSQQGFKPISSESNTPKPLLDDLITMVKEMANPLRTFTEHWIRTWYYSEQAIYFTPTEWLRLPMVALLVNQYVDNPDKGLLAEIRRSESQFGSTYLDRYKMQLNLNSKKDKKVDKNIEKLNEEMQKRVAVNE